MPLGFVAMVVTVLSGEQRRLGHHCGRARTTTNMVVLKIQQVVDAAVASIKSRPYHSFFWFGVVLFVFCGPGPKEINSPIKAMSSRTPPIMGDPTGCCSIKVTSGDELGNALKPSNMRMTLGRARASCENKYPLPRFEREYTAP